MAETRGAAPFLLVAEPQEQLHELQNIALRKLAVRRSITEHAPSESALPANFAFPAIIRCPAAPQDHLHENQRLSTGIVNRCNFVLQCVLRYDMSEGSRTDGSCD